MKCTPEEVFADHARHSSVERAPSSPTTPTSWTRRAGRRSSCTDRHYVDSAERPKTVVCTLAVWGSGVRVPLAPPQNHSSQYVFEIANWLT
jgi:hypothetical protein